MDSDNGKEIFKILLKKYGKRHPWSAVRKVLAKEATVRENDFYDPFKNLVIGILSQNTNDRNSTRAYVSLSNRFKITPSSLAKANQKVIANAIRTGGLYNLKAKRIKQLAKAIDSKQRDYLKKLVKLPEEEARQELLALPGIGIKTADVFLAYCSERFVLPVDTHINRVTKRLGIAEPKANYRQVQESLLRIVPRTKRVRAHEILIMFGREICHAQRPACYVCPVERLCPYPNKTPAPLL